MSPPNKVKYVNSTNVGLGVAAWLAYDEYDYQDESNYISVTSLIKPIRQLVLANRLPKDQVETVDLLSNINSKMGTAIHDKIEYIWKNHYKEALANLGYPKRVIGMVRINPTKEELDENPDILPVYLEQRTKKKVGNFTVGGKFDFCIEGKLGDYKTTKAYTYLKGTNDEQYRLQGSLYRWLAPEIITENTLSIEYIFMDWKEMELVKNPTAYPPAPTLTKTFQLYDTYETERYVREKLQLIQKLDSAPQSEIPECTDEELWRSDTVWKYYKNPANAKKVGARSTKNFTSYAEALQRKQEDKNVGAIVEVKGEVKACKYCAVCSICEQKDQYIADGSLKL